MFSVLATTLYLLLSFFLLCISVGLGNTLIGVRAALEAFSPLIIGMMTSVYYMGFVVGTRITEKFIHRVGRIRCFAALASLLSAIMLLNALLVAPLPWILLRFFQGCCVAGTYMVIESWLNTLAVPQTRGRIMAVYMLLNTLGLASGQLFFQLSDGSDFTLFAIGAILSSLSVLPLILSRTPQPEGTHSAALSLREFFRISPLSVMGVLCVGLVNGAFFGLAAPSLINAGFTAEYASQILAASFLGTLLTQWPLGSLSDRINRRAVILLSTLLAAASAMAIAMLLQQPSEHRALLLLASFAYGGFCYPVYSLLIALANDRLAPDQFVRASMAMLSLNGIAAIIGPLIASIAVANGGAAGLFNYIAGLFFLLAGIAALRLLFGSKLPRHRKNTPKSTYF